MARQYGGYSQVGYGQNNPYDQSDTHDTGYSNYGGRYNDRKFPLKKNCTQLDVLIDVLQ